MAGMAADRCTIRSVAYVAYVACRIAAGSEAGTPDAGGTRKKRWTKGRGFSPGTVSLPLHLRGSLEGAGRRGERLGVRRREAGLPAGGFWRCGELYKDACNFTIWGRFREEKSKGRGRRGEGQSEVKGREGKRRGGREALLTC